MYNRSYAAERSTRTIQALWRLWVGFGGLLGFGGVFFGFVSTPGGAYAQR